MSNRNPGDYPIPENTTSGTDLARILERTEGARSSNDAGSARPAYIVKGGIWTKTNPDGTVDVFVFDGTNDIPLTASATVNGPVLRRPKAGDSQIIQGAAVADVPLTLKGMAGQTGNLQEWKDSTGKVLSAVNSKGFVGINEAAPWSPLTIIGDDPAVSASRGRIDILNHKTSIPLVLQSLVDTVHIGCLNAPGTKQGALVFTSADNIEGMRIDKDSKVLIGASAPLDASTAKLQVKGTQIIEAAAKADVPLTIKGAPGQTASLQEWRDSAGEKMRIAADGKIGMYSQLGAASVNPKGGLLTVCKGDPGSSESVPSGAGLMPLAVARFLDGGAAVNCAMTVLSDKAKKSGVCFGDQDGEKQGRVNYDNANESMHFDTNHSEKMQITGTGEVLIATTASHADTGVKLNVNGKIASTAALVTSDRRLKDNIQPITDASFKVQSLNGCTYDKDGQPAAGLIAQDVQKVLPEAVSEGSDGMLSLDYNATIGLLTEALKDALKRIEQLEAMT